MDTAKRPLNYQALALEIAETRIRSIVKDDYLTATPERTTYKKVLALIREALKDVKIPELKDAGARSLLSFYKSQRREWERLNGSVLIVLMALNNLSSNTATPQIKANARRTIQQYTGFDSAKLYGVPLQKFSQDYINKNVKPVLEKLSEQYSIDPDDVAGRNSLRNRAEMEVRRQAHEDEINDLKSKGTKLVIASVHADCSERCRQWQGKVYSLDGTSGITDDGRKYQPLENATDIWYTTKKGKRYKNGLLGFNCFDKETQVYTDKGWIYFSQLSGDEKFYTLNKETKKTEWQEAVDHFKMFYNGDMVYLHSATSDLCVTPNHDLLVYSQKDKKLRYKQAIDFRKGTYQYAGQEWEGNNPETIKCGGEDIPTALYCKLLAYYLADGSRHSDTSIKIAQRNNDNMYNELCALPFKVWHDGDKIVIHSKLLKEEFDNFGKCDVKYIPREVKDLSREYLRVFLQAFVSTDGHTAKPSKINNKLRKPHRSVFTVSKRMADDLCEIALKAGYKPKLDVRYCKGKEITFRNGTYTLNYDLYTVHINNRTAITVVKKDMVAYSDYVYCVEVPNHTLLVMRKGRIQWCGNCRHFLKPYEKGFRFPKPDPKVEKAEYEITLKQRYMERQVIHWKTRAVENKGINPTEYAKARAKAEQWNNEYIKFSKANDRAYYPSRTKLI